MKITFSQLLLAAFFIVVFIFYFRFIEKKSIFFPMKEIELLPPQAGLEYEDVYFMSSDGVKLNGWFIPKKGARACVLYCHGNAGNISHRLETAAVFNEMGLDVFLFDYRGYGRSQSSPSERGLYMDARAAYDHLLSRGFSGKDIIFYGESLGCAVAIDLATKVDSRAVIIEGAFSSAKDVAKGAYGFLPVHLFMSVRFDSISKIKNINAPVLVIHSKDDEIIPFGLGQKLFDAANQPKKFCQLRGGHNDAYIIQKDKFASCIREFLAEN